MPAIYSEAISTLPNVDELFRRVGWQIDHLMAIDTRGKGIVPALYAAAVEVVQAPLAMTAAQRLRSTVGAGDVVGIITGAKPAANAGLLVTSVEQALLAKRGKVNAAALAFLDCPVDDNEARQVAEAFMQQRQPKALIAVEMPGKAADGFAHTASGRAIVDDHLAKADHFFDRRGQRVGCASGGCQFQLGSLCHWRLHRSVERQHPGQPCD